jgi:Nuclease A inhibitor-like protein
MWRHGQKRTSSEKLPATAQAIGKSTGSGQEAYVRPTRYRQVRGEMSTATGLCRVRPPRMDSLRQIFRASIDRARRASSAEPRMCTIARNDAPGSSASLCITSWRTSASSSTTPSASRARIAGWPSVSPTSRSLTWSRRAPKVYKVGEEAEETVYVIGKTDDGKYAGVRPSAVET